MSTNLGKNLPAGFKINSQSGGGSFDPSSLIPGALGTAGAIAGSFIEPVGGTIAGGAIGQGLGEWIRQAIKGQPINGGDIAKQVAVGSIFSAIPGGEEALGLTTAAKEAADVAGGTILEGGTERALSQEEQSIISQGGKNIVGKGTGILAKTGIRAALGGATGAAASAVNEINSKDTPQQMMNKILNGGIAGAWSFPVFGQIMDTAMNLGTDALKFVGEKLPNGVLDTAQNEPAKLRQVLNDGVKEMALGKNNVEWATEKGIITNNFSMTSDKISSSLEKSKNVEQDIATSKANLLGDKAVKSNESGFTKWFSSIADKLTALTGYSKQGESIQKQIISTLSDTALLPDENFNASAVLKGTNPSIPLSVLDKIKQDIPYNDNTKGIYNELNTLIKNQANLVSAGSGDQYESINQEALRAMRVRSNLSHYNSLFEGASPGKTVPEELQPKYIDDAVRKAALKNTAPINTIMNGLGLGGITVLMRPIRTLGSALGGIATMFGLRTVLTNVAQMYLDEPEDRVAAANALIDWYSNTQDFGERVQIQQVMTKLGIRLPVSAIVSANSK